MLTLEALPDCSVDGFGNPDVEPYVAAARYFQRADPAVARVSITKYIHAAEVRLRLGREVVVFLLMRVMFVSDDELGIAPPTSPGGWRAVFGGWMGMGDHLFAGAAESSWPVRALPNGRVEFEEFHLDYEGPPYDAAAEYTYRLEHCRFRQLKLPGE